MLEIKSDNDFKDFIDENLMFYTLLSFLKTRKKLKIYFPTPAVIEKSESPDFVIKCNPKSTGVEICSASPQNMRYASAIIKKFPKNSLIELDPNLFDKEILDRDEVKKYIKRPKENLTGYGWNGYHMEHSWAQNIIKLIKHKTMKLNTNYTIYDRNILLVDGDFLILREYEIANNYLKDYFNKIDLTNDFDTVFNDIFIISKIRNALLLNISI